MRLGFLLPMATAACAAAIADLSLFNSTVALMNAAVLPPTVDVGPHWPLPTEKIDCSPTYAAYNNYAWAWAVVRIQIEWIREDGPRVWLLPAGTPHGQLVRIGCCNEASINVMAQGRDNKGNPAPLRKTMSISGAEITTMALAVTDKCRSGIYTKGRAWSTNRDFTVEVFRDDNKCGKGCWQGD